MTPTIAVCMATYEPALDLLARQIRSIREQTHRDFVCIVSDDASTPRVAQAVEQACAEDERFRYVGNSDRVGYYRNFERCLELVPPGDRSLRSPTRTTSGTPTSSRRLLGAFDPERVQLAYTDMAIVSADGERWRRRTGRIGPTTTPTSLRSS